jgi:hypothetical protein
MTAAISQELFLTQLNNFLDETFENVMGIYLDKGTSLFETLEEISAEEASRPVSEKCASIAAQVKHITFYLEISERYIFTNDDFQSDWGEVWRNTREVTSDQWGEMRTELKSTYRHLRDRLNTLTTWDEERPFGGVWAIVAHTAYHLGEIRQATCTVKNQH